MYKFKHLYDTCIYVYIYIYIYVFQYIYIYVYINIYIYISEVPSGKTNIAGWNIPMFNRKYIFKMAHVATCYVS